MSKYNNLEFFSNVKTFFTVTERRERLFKGYFDGILMSQVSRGENVARVKTKVFRSKLIREMYE